MRREVVNVVVALLVLLVGLVSDCCFGFSDEVLRESLFDHHDDHATTATTTIKEIRLAGFKSSSIVDYALNSVKRCEASMLFRVESDLPWCLSTNTHYVYIVNNEDDLIFLDDGPTSPNNCIVPPRLLVMKAIEILDFAKITIDIQCSIQRGYMWCRSPTKLKWENESGSDVSLILNFDSHENAMCNIDGDAHPEGYIPFFGQAVAGYHQRPDEWIFRKLFMDPLVTNGIYLELGAFDGYQISNTLFFEKYLNWTGVLLEPEPVSAFKLLQRRGHRNLCLPLAVCRESEKPMVTITASHLNAGSGVKEKMGGEHIAYHIPDTTPSFSVPCAPLSEILKVANVPRIDLFSLDVEGSEFDVLQTMDWESVPVYSLFVELDDHNITRDNEIRMLLMSKGFDFVDEIGTNELWINVRNEPS